MPDATGTCADSATVLFNLPDYRVIDAAKIGGARQVLIESSEPERCCPGCGVASSRIHQITAQRLRDVPVAGRLTVYWRKRRYRCGNAACGRVTFTEHTPQVPAYARCTTRLKAAVVAAVAVSGRSADEVAKSFAVSWPMVQRALSAAVLTLADPAARIVRAIGVDEHRFHRVRFFRDGSGGWSRVEPWMSCVTDLDSGRVIGIFDGRDGASLKAWLAARPRWWRHRVQIAAIDLHAPFRKVLTAWLPNAAVVADKFHVVKTGNDMVTAVRRRLSIDRHGRRGRGSDFAWAHRLLLLRAGNTLQPKAMARLNTVFANDDPTDELSAAWAVKEQLRRIVRSTSRADARQQRALFDHYVAVADMDETRRLKHTVDTWWTAIEAAVITGASNARSEAVNLSNKQIKRTGRGFRNKTHYKQRIMLTNAARHDAA